MTNNVFDYAAALYKTVVYVAMNGPDNWGHGDIHELATQCAEKRGLKEPDTNCYVEALIQSVLGELQSFTPIAKVRYHKTGGNAGLTWSTVDIEDGVSPVYDVKDGEIIYVLRKSEGG